MSVGINLILSTLVSFLTKTDQIDVIAPIDRQAIRVMIFPHNPFVFFRRENKPSTPSGLDILILDNFAKRHGYQIEYLIEPNDSFNFNVFNSEELIDHFLESLNKSKIDIFAGGLEANSVTTKRLTPSSQYFQDRFALCLSKKPIPAEISFIYFWSDWYLTVEAVIAVLGILIVTYALQVFEYPRWDCAKLLINGLVCFLNSSSTFAPKSIAVRIGFASFLFLALLFCINFMARFMIWVTQMNYYPRLNSFEEIIDNGYYLRGDAFAFAKFSNINKIIPFKLCGSADECLNLSYLNQDIAVAISSEYFRSISKDITANIYCISEDRFSSKHGLNFLLQQDFDLKAELDRFISMANEGGLISKWMADLNLDHIKRHQHMNNNNSEVSMAHMISIYFTCGSIIALSLLVFLAEIIIHSHLKLSSKSKATQFWKILESLIDPERHFLNYDLRSVLPISYDKLK